MQIKNEVLYRIYGLLFAVLVPFALLLIWQTFKSAYYDAEEYREMGRENYQAEKIIVPERGDIYSHDESLLATSVPFFDLYFDPFVASDEEYLRNLDTLAYCLATYVDRSYTVGGMKNWLIEIRDSTFGKNRHVLIKKQVSYAEKRRIEQFPLFNLGRYRGGLIAEDRSERKRPFGLLARRTIGYVRAGNQPVGLEGFFDSYLRGQPGRQLMLKVDPSRNLWLPTEDLTILEPRSGDDIVTTLDVNVQDIAEKALLNGMRKHAAEWGTAIVMDVKTGAIRAIANLGRDTANRGYYEMYNYAIAMATEPGSTFKLASIMALLEEGLVKLEDTIDIERGRTQFYDAEMVDATRMSRDLEKTTVRRAFEISSNVGLAKLVNENFNDTNYSTDTAGATAFIERLRSFNLDIPTGITLAGEAKPYIKEAYSQEHQWSGLSLPWMATGYELRITPLQLLSFYNSVANGGRMMKPYLVSEIRRNGQTLETFRPTVVNKQIAGTATIEQARLLLEGVVQRGTAAELRSNRYDFAGKTGTAQINYRRGRRGTRVEGYQASFAGYFPANNPLYSCVVVIRNPQQGGFYGGEVAGPVFREIADKCFNAMLELHEPINRGPRPVLYEANLPNYDVGHAADIRTVLDYLRLPVYGSAGDSLTIVRAKADSLLLEPRRLSVGAMPNVVGMGLRDAIYELENRGLTVEVEGVGRVRRQSLLPGTRLKGQTVRLYLN